MSPLPSRTFAAIALMLAVGACSGQSNETTTASPSAPIASAVVAALPILAPAVAPETSPSATPTADAPQPTPEGTSAADAAAAGKVFADYSKALLARDFKAVCAVLDPSVSEGLIPALNAQGNSVSDCAGAFGAVYADSSTATLLDEASRTLTISDVNVDGDFATVTFSGSANGSTVQGQTNRLVRTDGTWLVLPPGA